MKANRVYKTFPDPSFPLISYRCVRRRVTPNFINIHWHSNIELIYIAEGSYEIFGEEQNYTAHAGSLCICPPMIPHCIRATTDKSEYWSMHFTPELITMPEGHFFQTEFVKPLQDGALLMPKFLPPEQVNGKMRDALSSVVFGKENWERFQGIMFLCTQLLPLCSRSQAHLSIPQGHPAVLECMQYIITNYASKLTLEELAAHVHLHPNYLCSLFKKDCGQSVFDVLTHQRIYAARKLLVQSRMTVAQIAESVGFNNADFFCRKFKQIIGVTPSAYRKNNYK